MTGRTTTTRVLTRRAALGIAALTICLQSALAQPEQTKPSYFGSIQLSNNLSFSSILAYDGAYKCGVFQQGYKWFVPSGRLGVSVPQGGGWTFGGAVLYNNLSTSYSISADQTPLAPMAYNRRLGYPEPVTRVRNFDAQLSMMGLSLFASYDAAPHLSIHAGPFAGFIVRHSYDETEQVVPPTDTNFVYNENGLRTRTIGSGSLNVNGFQAGLDLSVSYELFFQPNLWLRPSFGVMLPLRSISDRSTTAWRIIPSGLSLGLVYRANEPAPAAIALLDTLLRAYPEAPPTVPISSPPRPVLDVSIKAFGINEDGEEVEEPLVSIERLHVTEVYPMLHYVFFDDGASGIPTRYHQRTASDRDAFQESSLFTAGALEIHHNVLDILGKRLHEDPTASVALVGARSTHSVGDASRGLAISRERAESIAQYFERVWSISRARLHVRARDLPDVASDDLNAFGEAENRRVEIIPSNGAITAPLRTERIERVATPPHIRFHLDMVSSAGVRSATTAIKERDRVLNTFDALSAGSFGDYVWTLDSKSMPNGHDSLTYSFVVVDSLGDTSRADGTIHLRQKVHDRSVHLTDTTLDKEVEHYSLILFDYSSSQLDRKQTESIVRDMASSISNGSEVKLTGHTDKTGDDQFNEKLARNRVTRAAEMLQSALRRSGKGRPSMLVESHGSRDDLFDNSTPEGRVLSRTVRALIENEVQ